MDPASAHAGRSARYQQLDTAWRVRSGHAKRHARNRAFAAAAVGADWLHGDPRISFCPPFPMGMIAIQFIDRLPINAQPAREADLAFGLESSQVGSSGGRYIMGT
jgi:hypothetical protein